jgi:arylsulfatase A-like enzyme
MEQGSHPLDQGFDEFYGTPSSNDHFRVGPRRRPGDYRAIQDVVFDVPLVRQREIVERPAEQALFTRRYTEASLDWIRRHGDRPFFLYLAHNMPHVPVAASPEFRRASAAGPYGDAVEEIDWSVGRIVEALEREGLTRHTLILFTSDNGPWLRFRELAGSPGPFRDGKGTTWEGGWRVPAIFRWPGRIEPSLVDALGSGVDLWRTFASIASADVDPALAPDSLDLGPVLFEGAPSPRRTWFYADESGRIEAVRSDRHKLHVRPPAPAPGRPGMRPARDASLLFDLETDPAESRNLAARHPERVEELKRLLDAYRASLPAASP